MNEKYGGGFFKENWITLLLAAQPVLDAIAYWTQGSSYTVAGIIRLCILVALPLYLLIKLKKKRTFIISMLVMAVYLALHILNGFRVGYLDIVGDVSYFIRVVQMPVLAVCFIYFIRDERTRAAAVRGIIAAAAVYAVLFAAAYISGTANSTYGDGFGISGWAIDDNRCANSIILVTLSCFALYYSSRSDKRYLNILVPLCVGALLIINGTKACYGGLFALFIGYAVFIIMNRFVNGERVKKAVLITLAALYVTAVVIYPYTPRAKVSEAQAKAAQENPIEQELSALGYDLDSMTTEEKLNDPIVHGVFEHWYRKFMYSIPELFERFGIDRVLLKYNMSTDVEMLINTRTIKLNYTQLIWEDTDELTKLVGFEVPQLWGIDLENDWYAIFYYYGYLGICMYACFILYFVYLIIKRLFTDFKGSFNLFNFSLLICFILLLGLSQFSGALLRRPNASIYFSMLLALLYYRTAGPSKTLEAWGASTNQ